MPNEFIARNGLITLSGEIRGLLASGIVLSGSIASGQVSNFKLSSGASIYNLLSGSISGLLLGNSSIASGSIASGQVGQMHLSSGAITNIQLANASITNNTIASGQVSNFHLSSGASISNLLSGSISGLLLADNSVVSGSIGSGQVSRFHIGDSSVNNGNISENSVLSGSISSGQIALQHIASGSVFSGHMASGSVYGPVIGSGGISSGKIQLNQVGLNHLAKEVTNIEPKKNNLRISVVSGVPVSSGDLTARTTLFLVPYNGDSISLYDGTNWGLFSISGTAVSLSTAAIASGSIYDIYCYNNAGIPALELSAPWTGGITSRADAVEFVNGIPLKSGTLTRRFVGTVWGRNSGTIDDGRQYRGVWNWDNRVTRPMDFTNASGHTYNVSGGGNARPWNGNSGNALYWIQGIGGIATNASCFSTFNKTAGVGYAQVNFRTNINAFPWNLYQSTISSGLGDVKITAGSIESVLGLNWLYPEQTMSASGTFSANQVRLYNNIEG